MPVAETCNSALRASFVLRIISSPSPSPNATLCGFLDSRLFLVDKLCPISHSLAPTYIYHLDVRHRPRILPGIHPYDCPAQRVLKLLLDGWAHPPFH
jgi:hypothetical protein